MRPAETIPGMGGGDQSRMMERVNSSMTYVIYFKNFYKYHNAPPAQQ
jgi:hypothetical protein